ncbi:MAG: RagB/SusD family nutrient uptake outer membrane protein [Prevotellaceae bacterium]|jgi:hypothetical protein|nr:RagB/SusD family nutrient uptake outer membrane protein [Prevotellaceae bacterium]
MKKIFLNYLAYTAITFGAAAHYSCSKDDNPTNIVEVPDEVVITSDADAFNFILGILKPQGLGSGGSFLLESLSESTISFEGDDAQDGPLVSRFALTPTNGYVELIYEKEFKSVADANVAIDKISAIESAPAGVEGGYYLTLYNQEQGTDYVLSQGGKNSALGGAYFARALGYFYLVQLWGEVPLYTSSENATGGAPASVNAIYTQIESDLKRAEELLPDQYGAKTYPTKLVAAAVLSKVYLTWASAVDAGGNTVPAGDATVTFVGAKLSSAVAYADKVINSGVYALEKDFLKTQPGRNNKNSVEHIYNTPYVLGEDGPNDGGNHQAHCAFSYGFGVNPDENPTHIGPASFDLWLKWDGNHTYKQYDRRREFSYASYLRSVDNDSTYAFTPVTGWLPIFGKGIDRSYPRGADVGPYERDMDRLEIRYADVLLTKAEALIESNQNLNVAKDLINTIRRRAYNVGEFADASINPNDLQPGVTNPAPGIGIAANNLSATDIEITASDQAGLRAAVRKERANEFVYEQKRWLDLARWHNLVATVQSVSSFPEYNSTAYDAYAYAGTDQLYGAGKFYDKVKKHLTEKYNAVTANPKKYYRFPIPETARETNPNLVQNEGY